MKFTSEKYPYLRVNAPGGKSGRFADGELETTDAKVIEALRGLPSEYGVAAADGEKAQDDDEPKDGRPSKRASKEEWVDYAVSRQGVERAEAEEMTKADLVELYGG
jgi:hypothetical protein